MNYVIGLGAGLAAGMEAGMSAGRKKAAADLRNYMEMNTVTIRDARGEPILTEEFLHAPLGASAGGGNRAPFVAAVFLGILGVLGLVFFLLR